MTEPVEPKPEFRFMRFSVYSPAVCIPGRDRRAVPRARNLSPLSCINRSGFAVASSRGARRRVSQNSQEGATLCSEFGKHR